MFGPGLPDADRLLCGGPQLTPSGHQGGPDTRGAHVHPYIKVFHEKEEAGLGPVRSGEKIQEVEEEGANSLSSAPRHTRKSLKSRKDVWSSPLDSPLAKSSVLGVKHARARLRVDQR